MPDGVDQVRRNSRVACRGGEASCISRWTWNEGCAVLRCGRFERWRDACHVHRAWRSVQLQSAAEAGSANRLFEKGVAIFGAGCADAARWNTRSILGGWWAKILTTEGADVRRGRSHRGDHE